MSIHIYGRRPLLSAAVIAGLANAIAIKQPEPFPAIDPNLLNERSPWQRGHSRWRSKRGAPNGAHGKCKNVPPTYRPQPPDPEPMRWKRY